MRNFMSSLNRVSDVFSSESVAIRDNENFLNMHFANLQKNVRKSIIMRPKPKSSTTSPKSPFNPHPPHILVKSNSGRLRSTSSISKPLSNLPPNQMEFSHTQVSPAKKNLSPLKPNAAERIYNSHATQKMYEDILYGYADYLSNPTPAGVIQYESQIDPVLHVGSFDSSEVNRFAKISPLYSPPR